MDIMMPGMDGYQVTQRLKADPDTTKIGGIMLTARGSVNENIKEAWQLATRVQDRNRGGDVGALQFLTKPVKAKDLVQRVKAVLWASGFSI